MTTRLQTTRENEISENFEAMKKKGEEREI